MDDDELVRELEQGMDCETLPNNTPQKDFPVLAEIPITNFQLLNIANGRMCMISQPGESLGIRFMLKYSKKSQKSRHVVRNIVMQVVALGKDNYMRIENIATDVKVQTVKSKKVKKKGLPELNFQKDDSQKELF